MNEAADELERMAKVFEERVTAYEGYAAHMAKEGDTAAATANQAVAGAFLFAVEECRARAAALRAAQNA